VIDQADELLRLPDSALRVFELTQADDTQLDTLVEAIQIDPTLVAKLLRLANSPLFSRGTDITALDRAVAILGYQEVGQIAVVMAAAKEFNKIETELLKASSFWSHSLTTAVLARRMASQCGLRGDGVFVAALLHDLGLPVQFALCGNEMTQALDLSIVEDDISLITAENHVLGFDHTCVGARLCQQWQLPDVIVETARHHHQPANATSHQETVAIVAWANIVETLGTKPDLETVEFYLPVIAEAAKIVPLEMPKDDELLSAAQREATEMLSLF